MTSDRIEEIQKATAYPESISVYKALLQVWVESLEYNKNKYSKEDLRTAWIAAKNSSDFNEWFEQFKNK